MARTTITQITDDLDGSKNAKEVSFSFDGTSWTIDLSDKNKAKLAAALKPYMDAGTKAGRRASGRRGSTPRPDYSAIRTWAREQGHEVSDRGRVPKNIIEQYEESH